MKFLSDDPSDRYDVYLDGRLIGKTDPLAANQYWALNLGLDRPSNTDWVSLYLDEIVFGGNQPLLKANGPEETRPLYYLDRQLINTTQMNYFEEWDNAPFKFMIYQTGNSVDEWTTEGLSETYIEVDQVIVGGF
ncbi:MAG: hypothetical protein SVR81_11315 [Chloroflexota bacterium]|nr:hypothetical protein [Chloroflexota bacterium]